MSVVKLARVPHRVHTMDELLGLVAQLPIRNIVIMIEDDEGVMSLTLDGTTSERMNWMLDRAKFLLHKAD